MSYKQFAIYQDKAQALKRLQEEVDLNLKYFSSYHGHVADYVQDVHFCSTSIQDGLSDGRYGWFGSDAAACRRKLVKLNDDLWEAKRMAWDACDPIIAAIEEERLYYANLAMEEMRQFSDFDWAQCGWNSLEEWIKAMF